MIENKLSNWTYDEIKGHINNFCEIYKNRPIKDNKGGMLFPHMFAFYFILKKLNPELVIESGVFKGQSTWIIEQALPNSKIISIDKNLNQRVFISKKANYSNIDFRFHNFSKIPENTLVFFDDHVNHIERLKESSYFKIKNIIFEDNYPYFKGDFHTIKHSLQMFTFNHKPGILSLLKSYILFSKMIIKKILDKNYFIKEDLYNISNRIRDHYPLNSDIDNINKIIDYYYEFPPIIPFFQKFDNSNLEKFNAKDPLFLEINEKLLPFKEELGFYNYFTYIKIK
jgi:hypothetical protein